MADIIRTIRANGQDFEVYETGVGPKLALCLHGFPEHAVSWRHQAPTLASLGYRVWVPNQRGYGASSTPAHRRAYSLDCLLGDIAGLIDASGAQSVTLIAHDWGAILAWAFAAKAIRPLERLIILNVPHPLCFRREFRQNSQQRRKSWYVAFFQLPWLPEALLSRRNGAPVAKLLKKSAVNPDAFSDDVLQIYRDNAARPGGMRAMINWYRAAGRDLLRAENLGQMIETPTLLIWGEQDLALDIATIDGTDRYVRTLKIARLPQASHWVQQDAPEAVNALIADFLKE